MERKGKERLGNFEMNIRVGDGTPSPCPIRLLQDEQVRKETQEAAISAILDGYTVLIYNFIRAGTALNQNNNCAFEGFDLKAAYENYLE